VLCPAKAFERALIAEAQRRHGSLARTSDELVVANTTFKKYGLGDDSSI
jgi:two-component system C4-dicarboxylate transport response regulator DctD